ncbi:MAG: endonuclease MutS2 [Methanobacteriaceae archaeon]|nr:endonuclease MutS2 [Methanobacteriaceae archaeon]
MNGANLQSIKGIGNKLSEKIILSLGGEDELKKVIDNVDLERLTAIEGISQRKAIEIMNQLLGNPAQKFLKSERAFQLYEEIIEKIVRYSNTNYSKNRILLLAPVKDEDLINERLEFVKSAKDIVSKLPRNELKKLMKNLDNPKKNKANYDGSKVILTESFEDSDYLMELGLNKYYPIITASDSPLFQEEIRSYEFIFYVYSQGFLDFGGASNIIMINKEAEDYQIVPETILDYFKENRELFRTVSEIRRIRSMESLCDDVEIILNELDEYKLEEIDLDKIVENEKINIDYKLKETIENIDLQGNEILELLNNNLPPKIEKIFEEILSKSKETIKLKSGIDFDPFIKKYPIEIDDIELERVKQEMVSNQENNYFDKKIKAAEHLASIKSLVEDELKEAIEFDYKFALGCFAYEYKLNNPIFSDEIELDGALHLDLCLKEDYDNNIQRINYNLTKDENVALLTGANSGGKTTLLETISQIGIMSHIGLPVPARHAKIKLLDEIYHFSKKRSLDAGAFESFLNVFMPIVTSKSEKLVLLDELEGITELEAAVKIISSFIEMIQETDSYAIIVTHMANELMKYTQTRVDGIEATGLDENYNLIVDRTPKMNYLARSTPELIIKRMYEHSSPELKEVYGKILEKFN